MENGRWTAQEEGTPQGATISPLLANLYLHYVLDLWAHQWRKRHARGEVYLVRFADDFVVGFEHKDDAERFLCELRERLAKFALELNADKTRLIEFGRYAAANRERRGQSKPETFDFLGFTHACDRRKDGSFIVLRQTMRSRMTRKLKEVKAELRIRRHHPISEQGKWLRSVVGGYFRYHAVPRNGPALCAFRHRVAHLWRRALRRRSQKDRTRWRHMGKLLRTYLPTPRILHPYPNVRFAVRTRGKSRMR
jgi:hypothetical protein